MQHAEESKEWRAAAYRNKVPASAEADKYRDLFKTNTPREVPPNP